MLPSYSAFGTQEGGNGHADGTSRISRASIRINGTLVVEPEALNPQVFELEIPIKLEATNALSVELASEPGSFIALAIQ